jgi:diguanylate cyclase (GGDEF)-like protein
VAVGDSVVAGARFVAVFAGAIYATAGGAALLLTVTPQPAAVPVGSIRVVAALALLVGLLYLLGRDTAPAWSAHPAVLGGMAAVTAVAVWGGDSPTGVAFAGYYIFVALASGLFFSRGVNLVYQVLTVTTCVLTETLQGQHSIGAGVVISATAFVVGLGSGRVMELATSADVDPLTGLANRRRLDEVLGRAVAGPHPWPTLSVVILDLDHFKRVNDTRGHAEGDRLLREVTRAWTAEVEPGQLLARQGGDEFVLVLPGATHRQATAAVRRLQAVMPAGSSCSGGVAQHEPGETVGELLRRADAALYRAKRARPCVGPAAASSVDPEPAPVLELVSGSPRAASRCLGSPLRPARSPSTATGRHVRPAT